jgi:hypothetical protein
MPTRMDLSASFNKFDGKNAIEYSNPNFVLQYWDAGHDVSCGMKGALSGRSRGCEVVDNRSKNKCRWRKMMSEEKVSGFRCGKCGKSYEEAGNYLGVLFVDELKLKDYEAEMPQIECITFPWKNLGRRNYRNAYMYLLCRECEKEVIDIFTRPTRMETGYKVIGIID